MGSYTSASAWENMGLMRTSLPMKVQGKKTLDVPVPGYGTISENPDTLPDLIAAAIKAGIRHLDCAWEYGVEKEIGEGIRRSGVPRSEIFVTHKVNPHFYRPENIKVCLQQILSGLQFDYIDLLLLHLPVGLKPLSDIEQAEAYPGSTPEQRKIATTDDNLWIIDATYSPRNVALLNGQDGSIIQTWNAMKGLVKSGSVRAVGVSNFSVIQLQEILEDPNYLHDGIPLSANELEVTPYCQSRELLAFMKYHSITALGHSSFAASKWLYKQDKKDWIMQPLVPETHGVALLQHPIIKDIAQKYRADVGQIVQSWIVSKDVIPLGRSTNIDRVKKNLKLKQLDEDDIVRIDKLECPGRDGRCLVLENVFPGIKFPSDPKGP